MNSYFYKLNINNEEISLELAKAKIYVNGFNEFRLTNKNITWIRSMELMIQIWLGNKCNHNKYNFSDENQDNDCIVCISNKIDTVIIPCRHMCICVECI